MKEDRDMTLDDAIAYWDAYLDRAIAQADTRLAEYAQRQLDILMVEYRKEFEKGFAA